jgi:prepilin-type processing-associated H-X9-DG protein
MPDSDQPPLPPLDYEAPSDRNRPPGHYGCVMWFVFGLLALTVLGFAVTLMQNAAEGRETINRIKSAANLQSIGKAISAYTGANQGSFPDSFQTLLLSDSVASSVFVSPRSNDTPATGSTLQAVANQLAAGGHLSYVYLGRGMNAGAVTWDSVVAYEFPNDRYGGAVLFADGHVEFAAAGEIAEIVAKSKSGLWPIKLYSR